jgi:hypothetical protein
MSAAHVTARGRSLCGAPVVGASLPLADLHNPNVMDAITICEACVRLANGGKR